MKRKVTLPQARAQVVSRLLKGDGFRIDLDEYLVKKERLEGEIANMDFDAIRRRWPHHVWNLEVRS